MTDAGDKLIEAAKEALAVAKGEQPAARMHFNGHAYVLEAVRGSMNEVTHRCTAEIGGDYYGHERVMCAGVRCADGTFHNTCSEPCRWHMGKTGEGSPPWPESRAFDPTEPDPPNTGNLVAKARTLVALLDDAEVNHGGLYSSKTMRGRDDLRLEISRWPK